jgi:hypothetical protein
MVLRGAIVPVTGGPEKAAWASGRRGSIYSISRMGWPSGTCFIATEFMQ